MAYLEIIFWKSAKNGVIRNFSGFSKKMAWICKKNIETDGIHQKLMDFGAGSEKLEKRQFLGVLRQICPFLELIKYIWDDPSEKGI